MVKQEPTQWGLNVDIASLVTIAAFTALYYIVGFFITIPIGPTTFITFGEVFMWLGAALYGPVWGAIIGTVGVSYTAIVTFGSPLTMVGLVIEGAVAGLLMKKLSLTISSVIAQLVGSLWWYFLFFFIQGFGYELTMFIIAKGIVNQALNAVIATMILTIPGVIKLLPITYDSKPVRDLLASQQ
ncbi:MAG: ECF transporter S component [Candidatus Ranarchaeia archaeon]|jgi:uncharacterized membrane protein